MMFLHVSVAVLVLLSLGQTASPSSCESLIQPLEIQEPEQFSGKWIRVAVSSNHKPLEWRIKNYLYSFWVNITADHRSDVFTVTEVENIYGICIKQTFQMGFVNNKFKPSVNKNRRAESFYSTASLLKTSCPDCLLALGRSTSPRKTIKVLILMSRRQTVTAAELEELKKQAECLNLMEPFTMDAENELCPDPLSPKEEAIDWQQLLTGDMSMKKAIIGKIFSKISQGGDFIRRMNVFSY